MKQRALISVYNKEGILDLAVSLADLGWEILSTGGTSKYLQDNHIPVTDVQAVTGFPECLDGRVKTLHPAVHAGILARRDDPKHRETLSGLNLNTIDLVCVNLYPFFDKVKDNLGIEETIEFIDIGGPAMLRSAAKNYRDVFVLTDPADYAQAIGIIKGSGVRDQGSDEIEFRRKLAGKVFSLTSAYDGAIARYLLDVDAQINAADTGNAYPAFWPASYKKAQMLRYGENGHQSAALYLAADRSGALGSMEQLNGKELGYNNIRDLDLAWKAACAFDTELPNIVPLASSILPVCVAVKHNTPCGIGQGATLLEAYEKAYVCDPVSIFGGIVACTVSVDAATASKLAELFLEIVIAPDFEPQALEILKSKKNLRVMRMTRTPRDVTECIGVDGGLLVQQTDRKLLEKWDVVTKTKPDSSDIADLVFGLRAASYVKSNAIVVVKDGAALGIGGGQTNRIWAAEQALARASNAVQNAAKNPALKGKPVADGKSARVLASDAFFPFADVVEAAAKAGIKAIIQPGGSIRDKESIEVGDKHGIAMIFSGARHFKH